jgi:polar amino acid transport system permease protein
MIFDFSYSMAILPALLYASLVTLEATLLGMLLAVILGLLIELARRSSFQPLRLLAKAYVQVIRSTPLLIQLFTLFYVLPLHGISVPTFLCGILALGLHYASYTAEVYRAGIEGIPRGQWEAARSLGLRKLIMWRYVVLPQAIRSVLPMLANYLIAMFKDTPVLAFIGVHELMGAALFEASQTFRYYEPLTIVGLVFLVFSVFAALLMRQLEPSHASSR